MHMDMGSSINTFTLSNYHHNQQQQQQEQDQPAPAMAHQSFHHHRQISSSSSSCSDDSGYYSSNSYGYYNMEAAGKRQLFLRSYQFSRRKPSLMERIKKSSFIRAVKRLIRRLLRQLRSRFKSKSRFNTSTWKIAPRLLCRFNLVRSSSSAYSSSYSSSTAAAASGRIRFHRLVVVPEVN